MATTDVDGSVEENEEEMRRTRDGFVHLLSEIKPSYRVIHLDGYNPWLQPPIDLGL